MRDFREDRDGSRPPPHSDYARPSDWAYSCVTHHPGGAGHGRICCPGLTTVCGHGFESPSGCRRPSVHAAYPHAGAQRRCAILSARDRLSVPHPGLAHALRHGRRTGGRVSAGGPPVHRRWRHDGHRLRLVPLSASMGSTLVLVIDRVIRPLFQDFKSRMMPPCSHWWAHRNAGVLGRTDGFTVLHQPDEAIPTIFHVNLGFGPVWTIDPAQLKALTDPLSSWRRPTFASVMLATPAVMSASAKMSAALMSNLEPLRRGRGHQARRARLRIPEQGTADFAKLNRTFNQMVQSLNLAKRMENAFKRTSARKSSTRFAASTARPTSSPRSAWRPYSSQTSEASLRCRSASIPSSCSPY